MFNQPAELRQSQPLIKIEKLDDLLPNSNFSKGTLEIIEKVNENSQSSLLGEKPSKKVKKESVMVELKGVKQKFKEFHTTITSLPNIESEIKLRYERLQEDIVFKKQRVLLPDTLSEYFDRLCQKVQSNCTSLKKNWNEDETSFLVSLITYWTHTNGTEDHKKISEESWQYITSIFPGRSIDQIQQRWHSLLKFYISKDPWTLEEDKLMQSIVEARKDLSDWKGIANELNMRNPSKVYRSAKQCRERWNNHVNPEVDRGPWTPEQDSKLVSAFLEIGKKWSQIAKELGNRTENAVKNRWHSLMRRVGVIDGGSEISDLEEGEKAKQLFKLINGGIEYDKGGRSSALSVEKKESSENKRKGSKSQKEISEPTENGEDLHHKTSHQKSLAKRATGKQSTRTSENEKPFPAPDIESMVKKIQQSKENANTSQSSIAKPSAIESQLLNNLSYISNPKPSLQTLGSGVDISASSPFLKPFTGNQTDSNNLQLPGTLFAFQNGISYQLQSTLSGLANPNGGLPTLIQGALPIINSSGQTPAIAFVGGPIFFSHLAQQQTSITPTLPETNANTNSEAKNANLSQKEQLKRLASELETTLQQTLNSGGELPQRVESSVQENQSKLTLKIEEPSSRILEELFQQKHKYQFSLFNKEDNTVMFLDTVTNENLNLLKEVTKISAPNLNFPTPTTNQ